MSLACCKYIQYQEKTGKTNDRKTSSPTLPLFSQMSTYDNSRMNETENPNFAELLNHSYLKDMIVALPPYFTKLELISQLHTLPAQQENSVNSIYNNKSNFKFFKQPKIKSASKLPKSKVKY